MYNLLHRRSFRDRDLKEKQRRLFLKKGWKRHEEGRGVVLLKQNSPVGHLSVETGTKRFQDLRFMVFGRGQVSIVILLRELNPGFERFWSGRDFTINMCTFNISRKMFTIQK